MIVTHELASIFAIGQRCVMLDREAKGMIALGDPRELREHSRDPRVAAFFNRRPAGQADQRMNSTNYWKLGAFVLGGIALAFAVLVWLGAGDWNRKTRTIVTYFDESVQGLEVGAALKFRGVPVGTVSVDHDRARPATREGDEPGLRGRAAAARARREGAGAARDGGVGDCRCASSSRRRASPA